jgi:hypothetical protein
MNDINDIETQAPHTLFLLAPKGGLPCLHIVFTYDSMAGFLRGRRTTQFRGRLLPISTAYVSRNPLSLYLALQLPYLQAKTAALDYCWKETYITQNCHVLSVVPTPFTAIIVNSRFSLWERRACS